MWIHAAEGGETLVLEVVAESEFSYRFSLALGDDTGLTEHSTLALKTVERIRAALERLADESGDRIGSERYVEAGLLLFDKLLPETIRRRLLTHTGPLVVRSLDPELPWPLLHDGRDFLGRRNPLGLEGPLAHLVSRGDVESQPGSPLHRGLIVADPLDDLAPARFEAATLEQLWQMHDIDVDLLVGSQHATRRTIESYLASERYAFIHFVGRKDRSADGTIPEVLLPHGERLSACELGGAIQGLPLVFLNLRQADPTSTADQANSRAFDRGQAMASFVDALCAGGESGRAAAVVAANWWADFDSAGDAPVEFYSKLFEGHRAAGCLWSAEHDRRTSAYAPAPYSLHGDPSLAWRRIPAAGPERPLDIMSIQSPTVDQVFVAAESLSTAPNPPVRSLAPNEAVRLAPDGGGLLVAAASAARRHGTGRVCTLHLILAAADLEGGLLHGVLADRRTNPQAVRDAVERILPRITFADGRATIVTDNLSELLRGAGLWSTGATTPIVGERELLGALLALSDSNGVQFLQRLLEIDLDELRGLIRRGGTPRGPSTESPRAEPPDEPALEFARRAFRSKADEVFEFDLLDEPSVHDDSPTVVLSASDTALSSADRRPDFAPRAEILGVQGQLNVDAFSGDSWEALEEAGRLAARLHWDEIRSPIVFLALVTVRAEPIQAWLDQLHLSGDSLARSFRRVFRRREPAAAEEIPLHRQFLSDNTLQVLHHARRISEGRQIGPLDLLVACLSESRVTARALRKLRLDIDRLEISARELSQTE